VRPYGTGMPKARVGKGAVEFRVRYHKLGTLKGSVLKQTVFFFLV